MHITEVRFESFKSLYDVQCQLDLFTVLTGPNGAGKSNFVDALSFLGDVFSDGLEYAVGRAGGFDNIAHRRTRRAKRPVGVCFELLIDSSDLERIGRMGPWRPASNERDLSLLAPLHYRHQFQIKTAGQSLVADFEIANERLELLDSKRRPVLWAERGPEGHVKVHSNERSKVFTELKEWLEPFADPRMVNYFAERPMRGTSLMIEQLGFWGLFANIRDALSGIGVFQLSPYQCRGSGVPTPNASLERHGENLPGAANHLRKSDPQAWAQVESEMRDILPGLEGIEIAYTEDRRLALQFRERGVGRPWNTNEVSDGTIQSLAMYLTIFDRRKPLLVIEEPENAVHPWILRRLIDLFRSESVDKQFILTTHSPVLLNYVDPRSVLLVTIKDGRSRVRPLVDMAFDLREAVIKGDLSVFDVYDSGVLPEAVPRGMSPVGFAEDDQP